MIKYFGIALLLLVHHNQASVIVPNLQNVKIYYGQPLLEPKRDLMSTWGPHIIDFLELIDLGKVLTVAIPYLNDPEVLQLFDFMSSPKFGELIWELESIQEFKEAFTFLEAKGYNVKEIINFINNGLGLPPFNRAVNIRPRKGISGLIEDLAAVLPLEEMKQLFESKLETSPEVAELFETINSKEFMDIMKKMSQNPKFKEIMKEFESNGFDFKYFCKLAEKIFGDYYQGVFCE